MKRPSFLLSPHRQVCFNLLLSNFLITMTAAPVSEEEGSFSSYGFSPKKSFSLKSAAASNCVPLLFWTHSSGGYWFVAVAESSFLEFGLEVLEDGVVVHWTATPPQSLTSAFGLPETNTEVTKIEGATKISSPQPIYADSSLVEKIFDAKFRILKCKLKSKVKVLY